MTQPGWRVITVVVGTFVASLGRTTTECRSARDESITAGHGVPMALSGAPLHGYDTNDEIGCVSHN